MTKLLYILANPNPQGFSSRLGQSFLDAYTAAHPDDEVEVLNLFEGEPLPYFDKVDLSSDYEKKGENLSEEEQAKLDFKVKLADQLLSADKLVIVSPMWNFTIPAMLKSYIDLTTIAGKTFTFAGGQPKGLLETSKALFIASRGGDYSELPQFDFQNTYLKAIFGWLGVKEMHDLILEGSMMPDGNDKLATLQEKAKELAADF